MAKVAKLEVSLVAITDPFKQAMKDASKAIKTTGKNISKAGKQISQVSVPLAALGGLSLKAAIDFNKGMSNIATLIPGNAKRVDELKQNIQDMAVETGKSTADLTDGMYQVVSAFGDSAEAAGQLEIAAKAAAAGGATTTDAINLLSAVTKGYGDTSAEAQQKAADLAFTTVKLGQTTFPELAASIGKVVPLSNTLGVSQEELFAVMATATGVTGSASEVATQYRGVLQSLMAPTKTMSGLMNTLGFESGEAMIKKLGLKGSIDQIVAAAKKSGTPLQKYMGSIEGQTIALTLAGEQSKVYEEKLASMKDAQGAASEAYEEATGGLNSLGHSLNQAKQAVIVLAQNLGDALAPAISKIVNDFLIPLVKKGQELLEWFKGLDPRVQDAIIYFGIFLGVVGPIIVAIGTLITVIGALAGSAGILLLVGAIGAVTAAFFAFKDDFIAAWEGLSDTVVKIVTDLSTKIKDGFKKGLSVVTDTVKNATDKVTGFFGDMYDKVVGNSFVPDTISGIKSEFAKLEKVLVKPTEDGTKKAVHAFHILEQGVKKHGKEIIKQAEKLADKILDMRDKVAEAITDLGEEDWPLKDQIVELIELGDQEGLNKLAAGFEYSAQAVEEFSDALDAAKDDVKELKEEAEEQVGEIADLFSGIGDELGLGSWSDSFGDALAGVFTGGGDSDLGKKIHGGLESIFGEFDATSVFAGLDFGGFAEGAATIIDGITKIGKSTEDTVTGISQLLLGSELGGTVGGFISDVFGLGGTKDPGSIARENFAKAMNEMLGAFGEALFGEGGMSAMYGQFTAEFGLGTKLISEHGHDVTQVFWAIGEAIAATSDDVNLVGQHIGWMLQEQLGGSFDKVGLLLEYLGYDIEDVRKAVIKAGIDGTMSWLEVTTALNNLNKAFEPGLVGVGKFDDAFQNLIESAGVGAVAIGSLKDIATEAKEAGITTLDELEAQLVASGKFTKEQIAALMLGMSQLGIENLSQLEEANEATLGAIVAAMDAAGQDWSDSFDEAGNKISVVFTGVAEEAAEAMDGAAGESEKAAQRMETSAQNIKKAWKDVDDKVENVTEALKEINKTPDTITKHVKIKVDVEKSGDVESVVNEFGNVFNLGKLKKFAKGGIVSGPTIMALQNGLAILGEAGPEAVLPLKRGQDGKLGVSLEGETPQAGHVINIDARGAELGAAEKIKNEIEKYFDDNNKLPGRTI